MLIDHFLLSPLQSDWFFSDAEDKGERVSDAEGRWGGVWSEVGPHLRWRGQQDSSRDRSLTVWHPQSDGGNVDPLLRSLQSDGGLNPCLYEPSF